MAVIVGLACLMTYILMSFVKERTRKAIDKVHKSHSFLDIVNERNKMKRILAKQGERKLIKHPKEKIHAA
jgi:hypothetical protein